MSFFDKLGKVIHSRVSIAGKSGYDAEVTPDGKLKVDTNVTVDSVTVTDVKLKDAQGNEQKYNADGSTPVQLTGSLMEYYGATVTDRPAANSVRVGAVFMAVNSGEVWQSNGADWVVR